LRSTILDARNILVIDFGQLGDLILSLPAMEAIRKRFPEARVTIAVGKPGKEIVQLAGCADDILVVDRVALRDGFVPASLWQIHLLIREVRRRRFDFVIDLHSLPETNLLGFLSGAPRRLYSRRPRRSLDWLSNFRPRPPLEDLTKHVIDRYLDVLFPLAISEWPRTPRLPVIAGERDAVDKLFRERNIPVGGLVVGIFPGAGHPSRQWPLGRFAELAFRLQRDNGTTIAVVLGPEEGGINRRIFPAGTVFLEQLSIPRLAAALARLTVLIGNDTGPMHVAAAVGTPVVVLLGHPTNRYYMPREKIHRVVHGVSMEAITVDQAYGAARSIIESGRSTSFPATDI
jgi:heptosyltransferase-1